LNKLKNYWETPKPFVMGTIGDIFALDFRHLDLIDAGC
jgi:hypothetical protein